MADPFSIAAGVVGILSLAEVVYQLGREFWRECKDCPKELKALVLEINSLKAVLEALELLIEDATSEDLRMTAPGSLRLDAAGRRARLRLWVFHSLLT
jgi:hypothetical protein